RRRDPAARESPLMRQHPPALCRRACAARRCAILARMAPEIRIDPAITPDQLHAFYRRNQISEAAYSQERAAVVLVAPGLVVAAFAGDALVGLVRVLTDGLAAAIMEFSVELALQGPTVHGNGSLIEGDRAGLASRLGEVLIAELTARRIDFVAYD